MTEKPCIGLVLLLLAAAALCACQRAPAAAEQPRVVSSAPPPRPPARNMVMICRSSRTGLKAQCGTPDAVMVGMKPE